MAAIWSLWDPQVNYQSEKEVTIVAEVFNPDYHEVMGLFTHNEGKDFSTIEIIHLGVSWYFHAQHEFVISN